MLPRKRVLFASTNLEMIQYINHRFVVFFLI
jgi:hypothetical protein